MSLYTNRLCLACNLLLHDHPMVHNPEHLKCGGLWNPQFSGYVPYTYLVVVSGHVTCQINEISLWKTIFSPRNNEFDIHCLTGVCLFFSNIYVWTCIGIPEHTDNQQTLRIALKIKKAIHLIWNMQKGILIWLVLQSSHVGFAKFTCWFCKVHMLEVEWCRGHQPDSTLKKQTCAWMIHDVNEC